MEFLDGPALDLAAADRRYPPMQSLAAMGASRAGQDVDAKPYLNQVLTESVYAGRAVAFLDMGFYRLKGTFNPSDQSPGTPDRVLDRLLSGFTFFGGWGKIAYPPSGGGFPNGAARYFAAPEFIWYGTDGGVMWEFDSMYGMAIIGVAFRGRPTGEEGTNRAGIGLNISQRNLGLPGSGVHLLDRVAFNDMAVGLKFGEGQVTGGGNCDTTTLRDASFQSVDTCILLIHQQNLVYNIVGTSSFVKCTTIVQADKGGYFVIDDLNANTCGGTGPDDWMFDLYGGANVGTNKISRARLEAGQVAGCRQVARLKGGWCELLIEGMTEAQDNQLVRMFEILGGQLTMIGGKLETRSAANPTFYVSADFDAGRHGSVRLYGMRLAADTWDYSEWFDHHANAQPHIVVRDCELDTGARIPSFSTRLEDGLPVPLRATTTSTSVVVSTLRNTGVPGRVDACCAAAQGAYRVRCTIVATTKVDGIVTGTALRAVREFDVLHTAGALTISTPETIGVDNNPAGLSFTIEAAPTQRHLSVHCTGVGGMTHHWTTDFQLIGGQVNAVV
jgi:hypothetical protein